MRALLAFLFVTTALVGCMTAEPDHDLTATGVPSDVTAGEPFTFQVQAEGGATVATDHLGAHYWSSSVADEDATASIGDAAGCDHTEGDLPGTWDVTCTITSPGTYYVRGHARITDGEGDEAHQHDFWSEEHQVHVQPTPDNYVLFVEEPPLDAAANEPFTFQMVIDGPPSNSDHIGAHHWDAANDTGDIADAGGCAHQEGDMPGTYTVSCTLEPGEYVVRGHMRLTLGEQKNDFWAEPFHIVVA